ncbi:hypothetical protein H4F99_02445 [Lysobacter sp. SG-8]|uniref:DUF3784 domain-containing protein n=1 Tax=Marilutibacter penaei TaxID=2759900 RepID=A0A7W3YDK5_9GAMM|nr:hypothetical protein [Lysobacter penaei]MBB1087345.1 hypothetical protein [Lysobacter penaei]
MAATLAQDLLVPLVLFASSLPMFAIAWRVGQGDLRWLNGLDAARLPDPAAVARRLGWLLASVGFALWLGALGLYWAGDRQGPLAVVTVLLLVAVNGLGLALFIAARRARRDYLPPRDGRAAGGGNGRP